MSARLPSLRGDAVVRALKKSGLEVVRIKGSHHVMEHADDPARTPHGGSSSCR
ncbi:MAG TPA: type II toxin-antitoxin system HicA family toxin [Hyphomicrobiaceae bacterium]|nr:type II toxin-antitoxin system HicA family toxin [Hyphomicrobiaceae bacterium]